jgi:H+/Cl- antiporter ClcA
MVYSISEIGYGLYFLGLGLLGGLVGNIMATWYNSLQMSKHTDERKKELIYLFISIGVVFTAIGIIIIYLF